MAGGLHGPGRMRAALLLLAVLPGCVGLEPEATWEEAWGALDQEELRVSMRLRGTLARPFEGTAPPATDEVALLVRRQLEAARAPLETHALVEPVVDDVKVDLAKLDAGRLLVRWTARVTTKRPAGASSDDGGTLAFELSLPENPDDPTVLVPIEAEVVEAAAAQADARVCRPTAITIDVGSYDNRAYGYSFVAKVGVAGAGIDACDIRQLVTLTNTRNEWDGTATPDANIRDAYDRGLWDGLGTGRWVVDTYWNWQALSREGKHDDSQLHNIPNRRGPAGEGRTRTEVQLDRTTRRFLVQVRDRATGSMRAIRQWRYSWSNDDARLPEKTFAGSDVAIGRFTGCLGITGVGRMNQPQDDCP